MTHHFARTALFSAALALASTAHAADLATVSSSITGLTYHLVDLDPNDGIAPSIQFHGGYVATGLLAGSMNTFLPTVSLTAGDIFPLCQRRRKHRLVRAKRGIHPAG